MKNTRKLRTAAAAARTRRWRVGGERERVQQAEAAKGERGGEESRRDGRPAAAGRRARGGAPARAAAAAADSCVAALRRTH